METRSTGPIASIEDLLSKASMLPCLKAPVSDLVGPDPSDPAACDPARPIAKDAPLPAEADLLQLFDARDPAVACLWSMSTLAAHLSQILAQEHAAIGIDPRNAYGYGLLHDIGYLALVTLYPERAWNLMLRKILPAPASLPRERAVLGITHTVAGGLIACRWRLPEEVTAVITTHHREDSGRRLPPEAERAADLMRIVDDLVHVWIHAPGAPPTEDRLKTALASLDRQILYKSLGITIADLALAAARGVKALERTRAMLGGPLFPSLDLSGAGPEDRRPGAAS